MISPLRSNFKILSTKVFSKISSFGDTRSQNKMIVGYCLHTDIASQALTDIISLFEHKLCKVCIDIHRNDEVYIGLKALHVSSYFCF